MKHFVGIDIGSSKCVAAVCTSPSQKDLPLLSFENTLQGITEFERWLGMSSITPETATICMESCGVYAETLCYALAGNGWHIHVDPPMKVRRAMPVNGAKSDEIDAQNIARYAVRYADELHRWQPRPEILEHVSTLLTLRESYTEQSVAMQNQLHSIKRKHIRTKSAEAMLVKDIARAKVRIKKLDKEIRALFDSDDSLKVISTNVESVPGVGLTLTAYLMIITNCFGNGHTAKELASHLGMAPLLHESGTSVYHKPRSRGFGHSAIRRLLYLGAMSVATHNSRYKEYFARMVSMGKNKHLVINNIENKLLSTIFAVVKTNATFSKDYAVAS